MSPEYAKEGNFSEKSYSFGVLLLKIVTGRRNTRRYSLERPPNLVGYLSHLHDQPIKDHVKAWELWKEGSITELIDSTLADDSARPQIMRCIHVGLLCVQDSAADRPTMADVLPMLANQSMPLPVPKHATIPFQPQMEENSYRTKQGSSSVAMSLNAI